MKNRAHNLTEGNILGNLLRLSGPIILSNILQDLFNVVDMIFVGRLGAGAIAAVAMSGNLLRLIGVISLGISTGAGIMVAQFLGAKHAAQESSAMLELRSTKAAGENIAMQALFLCVACAVGIGLLGYPLSGFGLRLLGAEPEVVQLGLPYMHVMLFGLVTLFLSMTLNSIFRAAGDAVTPMLILGFSTVLNLILDPILIFGFWKIPAFGVVGSAYATVMGQGLGVVVMLYLCLSGRGAISLVGVDRRINIAVIRQMFSLGIFSSMQGFWRHISRVVFIRVVAIYGTQAVAAYAVCMRLRILAMNPGFGVANAVGPMVGQNLGANQIERAEKTAWTGNALGVGVMTAIGLLFFVAPRFFIRIFTDEPAVIEIAQVYLRYLSLTSGFIAVSIILGRALSGAGDTVSPMAVTLICQLGVGLALVLALSHLIGLIGVWIGIALSNVIQGVVMWYWFKRGKWKTRRLVK